VGGTIVIVSHRLVLVQNADYMAFIEKWSVVEKGNHTHLMTKGEGDTYFGLISPCQRKEYSDRFLVKLF